MAKISPVAAKYIIHASIKIDGVVDRPDVIGAIFGQTEGLLGSDLELRELQRSGKIGRIEVNVTITGGKTNGEIIIPSSLDKTETAIVGAALEIIQRIGPCNAHMEVTQIEDVRISKRQYVIERAKALLKDLTEKTLPDSQELADEVAQSVRMMEVMEYGREKLAAGPMIDESEEVIIVEGRADVLVLLKHGFKNAIALNGTSVPETIKELSRKKTLTVFVDGDRGGNLIVRELLSVADIDFVCRAPDGKEVEELTKKEIHKSLRGRITAEQAKLDLGIDDTGALIVKEEKKSSSVQSERSFQRREERPKDERKDRKYERRDDRRDERKESPVPAATSNGSARKKQLTPEQKQLFKQTLEDLFGTRGACILDEQLQVLGKVPLSELVSTMKGLYGGIYAVILDGTVDIEIVRAGEKLDISYIVGTASKVRDTQKVTIVLGEQL